MSKFADEKEIRQVLGGFFERFSGLDPIIREAVGRQPLVLKLELVDPALSVRIDITRSPLLVSFDSDDLGTVGMSAKADEFHDLLLGSYSLAEGINNKRLVVRGATAKLMKAVPLFFLAPHLYPFYLESIGRSDLLGRGKLPLLHGERAMEDIMTKLMSIIAYPVGLVLGLVKRVAPGLDVVAVLESMGSGLRAGAGEQTPEE